MERKRRKEREMVASWIPFGLGLTKPKHFREMTKIAWENRDNLRYAWKVLTQGVCDGCALGTTGLKDWTVEGTHLCMVRLELLRLNTMGALDPALLADVAALRSKSSKELRDMGRIPYPMRRRTGEAGFTRVRWEDLWAEVGATWRGYQADRTAMFVTSRGLTNENYYVAGKVMRYLGSPHVDNSARLCHSPSTAGLKATVGVAATTCSYTDWFESDLIVFLGSNPANDQPVSTKYLMEARKRGARVITVNAYREPGMKRYWIPSSATSALFGTTISDRDYMVKIGGDLAFLNAAAKLLVERGAVHTEFLDAAVEGYEEFAAELAAQSIEELCALAGVERSEVEAFADELAGAERGVLVWSMGITQHPHGAETVKAIANLGLLKEWVGREGCGLMPIRGHSGVQGGAEMGAYSTAFPGGLEVNEENARRFEKLWGFPVPHESGMTTVDYLEASIRGELDALYCIGGNFLETMPEPDRIASGLAKIPLRIHSDIVITNQMLVDPAETVFLLPARTRYEQEGGGTETSTERRVIYSPTIPGHQVGEAETEWRMMLALAKAVRPDDPACPDFVDGDAIRAEIAQAVPSYAGIEKLHAKGDQFQWGGPHLCADRRFPTADGRAHLVPVRPPFLGEAPVERAKDQFTVATRRGKQFNSMVQRARDPLTGAMRDHVFMHPEDAAALGLQADDRIALENETGRMDGRVFLSEVTRGTLQAHWPEINVVIPHGSVDAGGGVPNYNAIVTVSKLGQRKKMKV
jgi:molybdopterin-dependent oxidoreductase alpha subunit